MNSRRRALTRHEVGLRRLGCTKLSGLAVTL
jgi:hypothetical protein